MRITIPRQELREAVTGLGRVVNTRTTLPILGGVRFEANGVVTAQSTDLDQTARYQFSGAQSEGEGVFVVPFGALKDLSHGKGNETVELEAGPDLSIAVTNHVGAHVVKQPLAGMDPDEWPALPGDVSTKPADGFLEAYRRLVPFASKDKNRFVLNSVFIEVADKGEHPVTMVATDGRRMTCQNTMNLPLSQSVVIPTTRFLQWNGLAGEVGLGLRSERHKKETRVLGLAVHIGPWAYDVKVIDGSYPNWRQAVPSVDGTACRITFTDEDAAAFRRILPALPDSNSEGVALRAGKDGNLTIARLGHGHVAETTLELTGGSRIDGELPAIGVNAFFLSDALGAGFRVFAVTNGLSPLRSDDNRGGIHVLMPLRLIDERAEPQRQENQVADQPAEATGAPVPEPSAAPASTAEETPHDAEEAGVEPTKRRRTTVTGKAEPTTSESALDRAIAACDAARARIREANQALGEATTAVREAVREDKQRRLEVENVRAGLAKLQQIKV